ncbi:putative membrane protein [Steroidobacter denitrificans]|uniref:Putative membrane protein n=1 Tax=Steroidobacter denitrificans TaxID=465721 RepID=A0A127FDL0_STEDE|nr:DUF2244 domain-containing protein [Steroidobacter denitrificans]AMN48442.1 putative membrane protein [Steroidobacter denitrificans]
MNIDLELANDSSAGLQAAAAVDGSRIIELRPRCALTPRTACICLLTVALPTFTVAGIYTLQGFWPILGFAALEIGLLGWALCHSMLAGKRGETITVTADSVTIARHTAGGRQISVFLRHWTRVRLKAPLSTLHPSRLTLESQGRVCEVGRFLTEDDRRILAARLQRLVGSVNQSPTI